MKDIFIEERVRELAEINPVVKKELETYDKAYKKFGTLASMEKCLLNIVEELIKTGADNGR